MAKLILKEKIWKSDIVALVFGFIGMIMIVEPSKSMPIRSPTIGISRIILNKPFQFTDDSSSESSSAWKEIIGVICALLASISGAMAVICTKKLSNSLHESVVGYYFCLGVLLLSPTWTFV